jgi:hypothetical protein
VRPAKKTFVLVEIKKPSKRGLFVVAGTGFEPATFGLFWSLHKTSVNRIVVNII